MYNKDDDDVKGAIRIVAIIVEALCVFMLVLLSAGMLGMLFIGLLLAE